MYTITTKGSSKIIIKHIKYELNEQQYIKTEIPARCRAVNNGQPVRCRNPLWEERTIGTTATNS